MIAWVVTDGKAGMEVQCLGLAEAAGLVPVIRRVRLRQPWHTLSPWLPVTGTIAYAPVSADGSTGSLEPPWPDVLIASGRRSAGPALHVRRASRGQTFVVQIQDPRVPPRLFDLLIVPRHDRATGANVITTRGSLHRITASRLALEAAGSPLSQLPHPRLGVLLGGNNPAYRMTPAIINQLGQDLIKLASTGVSVMVIGSRRTPDWAINCLRQMLQDKKTIIWDGTGANPYLSILATSDSFIVTSDSVNMVSEAAATGKPVHILALEGGSAKFKAFHNDMREAGITRPFTGSLASWSYHPLNETVRVADVLRACLAARRQNNQAIP